MIEIKITLINSDIISSSTVIVFKSGIYIGIGWRKFLEINN